MVEFNEVMIEFKIICLSIDARLAAHRRVTGYRLRDPRLEYPRNSVYLYDSSQIYQTNINNLVGINRDHQRVRHREEDSVHEMRIHFVMNNFGAVDIQNRLEMRTRSVYWLINDSQEARHVNPLPLMFVIHNIRDHHFRKEFIQWILRDNHVKYTNSMTKAQLIRLFLNI